MSQSELAVTSLEATTLLERSIRSRIPAMVKGSPGIGKSQIVRQLADKFGLKLIDVRLAECDPSDLRGFPYVDEKTGKAKYAPMAEFPLKGEPIPEGYNGWLLFLDEMNQAPDSIQRISYKVLLDHKVGDHELHERCVKLAAGNLITDGALAEEMGTALQSRLVHLEMKVDYRAWLDWAMTNKIDSRITSFIQFKPDLLHRFDPDHNDNTFACPRTWEFASNLLAGDAFTDDLLPLIAGTVSNGVAREFYAFTKIYEKVASADQIAANPLGIDIPVEMSILYAQTGSIGSHANAKNISALMQYIARLPMEFQVVCLREICRRTPNLIENEAVADWISNNASELF